MNGQTKGRDWKNLIFNFLEVNRDRNREREMGWSVMIYLLACLLLLLTWGLLHKLFTSQVIYVFFKKWAILGFFLVFSNIHFNSYNK